MNAFARELVSLRRLRRSRSSGRHALIACVLLLSAFGVWRAIDPPVERVVVRPAAGAPDLPAQGFARAFTAAYLSYDAAHPEQRTAALQPFAGQDADPEFGFSAPERGARKVSGTWVAQVYPKPAGNAVLVVGADTDRSGIVYLAVTIGRDSTGALHVVGLPALTGAPAATGAVDPEGGDDVANSSLETTIERAMRSYLEGRRDDLAADLTRRADVALPGLRLRDVELQALSWQSERSVSARLSAIDPDGARLTLTYEIDVVQDGDRWFVDAIQTLPTFH